MNRSPLLVLLFMLICNLVYAHPPSEIIAEYDRGRNRLKVIVKHDVSNPGKHFIEKITVKLNEKKVLEKEFNRQESYTRQELIHKMRDARAGDTIYIRAECNMNGMLSKEIKIYKKGVL